MVLSQGRVVYYGQSSGALPHFATLGYVCPSNFNPADFIIDTVATANFSENIGEALPTFDNISTEYNNRKGNASKGSHYQGRWVYEWHLIFNLSGLVANGFNDIDEYASPFWVQFQVLTQRTFLNVFRYNFIYYSEATISTLTIKWATTIFSHLSLVTFRWNFLNYNASQPIDFNSLNHNRSPFLLKIQYSVTIVVALLLGYLYYHVADDLQHGGMKNRMEALFFMCALLSFSSITSIDLCT